MRKDARIYEKRVFVAVIGLITLGLGTYAISCYSEILAQLIGVFFLFSGVYLLILSFLGSRKKINKVFKDILNGM